MERSSARRETWRKYIRDLLDEGLYGGREAELLKA